MAGSYVGRLDTKTTSLRSACLNYLGPAIPWYVYGSTNLVGCPGCVTFWGRCALVALPACSRHQWFYVRNEGLLEGCAPNGPAKYLHVLGAFVLRPSLGRHASGGSTRLFVAMQDIWVSLHSTWSRFTVSTVTISDTATLATTWSTTFLIRHTFQDPVGYPRIPSIVDLRPLWGRHAQISLRSALPDSLQLCSEIWLSLHFVWIKTMTWFCSLFGASNQPCCLLQCSGTTLRVHLRRPLVSLFVPTYCETRFSSRRYSTYFFFFFGSSYRPSCPSRCSDTTHECIFDALWIFSSSFRSIGSLLPIGRHSTSLRSARIQTGRLLSWTHSFFFLLDLRACYSTCR
jgi:hypothetical protein